MVLVAEPLRVVRRHVWNERDDRLPYDRVFGFLVPQDEVANFVVVDVHELPEPKHPKKEEDGFCRLGQKTIWDGERGREGKRTISP